jgi:hypothetical protein
MEQVSYEAVEPFWVEWKRSSRPRTEPEENRRLSIMKNIFLAVAGHECGTVDNNALEFVRSQVHEWQESLRKHSEDDTSVLFRGIVDIQAIEARTTGYTLSVGVPISFAFSEVAARGFAGRGHIEGALISAAVPLCSVVFCDREGFFREANAHQEAEVVVVLSKPIQTRVLESSVAVRKPWCRTRTARRIWDDESERLRSLELTMNIDQSVERPEKGA